MRKRDPELSENWGTICTPVRMTVYIPSMLIHLHGQAVPVSRRMRTTLTETVPF